jgi:hypothetical protein
MGSAFGIFGHFILYSASMPILKSLFFDKKNSKLALPSHHDATTD